MFILQCSFTILDWIADIRARANWKKYCTETTAICRTNFLRVGRLIIALQIKNTLGRKIYYFLFYVNIKRPHFSQNEVDRMSGCRLKGNGTTCFIIILNKKAIYVCRTRNSFITNYHVLKNQFFWDYLKRQNFIYIVQVLFCSFDFSGISIHKTFFHIRQVN